MRTTVLRKHTSFRLREDLLEVLQNAARQENCSLNSFVENALMDVMYAEPNEVTKAAMEEARLEKNLRDVDTSSFENFIKSCSE